MTVKVPAEIVVVPLYVLTPANTTVPVWLAPLMVKLNAPSTMPFTVSVLPEVAASPLAAVILTPRLASNIAAPVACNVPPLSVIEFAVIEVGTAPKFTSVVIDKIPAEMVVIPV